MEHNAWILQNKKEPKFNLQNSQYIEQREAENNQAAIILFR